MLKQTATEERKISISHLEMQKILTIKKYIPTRTCDPFVGRHGLLEKRENLRILFGILNTEYERYFSWQF